MGRYYRQYLGEQSAVMAAGCPARESVYVYADTMQRTKHPALLDGFAAGCGLTYRTKADGDRFNPPGRRMQARQMIAQTRVLERTAT
jgi:hypothetical protein